MKWRKIVLRLGVDGTDEQADVAMHAIAGKITDDLVQSAVVPLMKSEGLSECCWDLTGAVIDEPPILAK